MISIRYVLIILLMLVCSFSYVQGVTHDVTNTDELVAALNTAVPGDVVRMSGGVYNPGGPLEIPTGVTIEGGWNADFSSRDVESNITVIDGQGAHALFVSNGTTEWLIDGLTLTGGITQPGVEGEAGNGSVLRVTGGGSGVLRKVTVTANDVAPGASAHGTAIWVTDAGSSLVIEQTSFTENFDSDSSAAGMVSAFNDATLLKIEECTFKDNVVYGGLLRAAAADELIVMNSIFESNTTNLNFLQPEAIDNTFTDCIFKNNVVINEDQDILFADTEPALALVIENTVFEENVTPQTIIRADLPINVLDNVSIVRNTSSVKGRILDMRQEESLSIVTNSLIENNTSQNESLITLRGGENEITNTVIRGNVNTDPGDQILHIRGDYFKMENTIIEGNASNKAEFLTLRSKEVLIYDSIIRNNQVPDEMIEVRPDVDVRFEMINTIIYNNNVAGSYPVRLRAVGPSSILNCTIVDNVSGPSTINAERDGSEYFVINNIFSGNTASDGNNPLINTAPQIEFEAKHNLVWDWEGKVNAWEPTGLFLPDVDGNFEGDPMFVDGDGGDLRLQEGSAAIDAGMTLDNVTADIAGVERPQGAAYDIGAYEYVSLNVTTTAQLVDAIATAIPDDVIPVAAGTYTPGGPLEIPNGVTIEGGWNTDFSNRDVEVNVTVIDGQGAHALLVSNGTTEWVVDGLTLTGGITQPGVEEEAGNGSVLRVTGGGSGVLRNVTVTANDVAPGVSAHGTAIWVTDAGSSLLIEQSSFTENFDSDSSAAGMVSAFNDATSLKIEESTFKDNVIFGGLLRAAAADELLVMNSVFEANTTNLHFLRPEAIDNTITECIFKNNEVVDEGQDILFSDVDPAMELMIENTIFEENVAPRNIVRATLPTNVLDNVSIVRNTSSVKGRILDMSRGGALNSVINSLIENNTSQNESLINLRGGENELINTAIRGNVNTEPGDQILHIRGDYFKMEKAIIEDNASSNGEFMTLRSSEVLIYDSIIRNNQVPDEMIEVRPNVDVRFEMINTIIYNNNVAGTYPVRLRAAGPSLILNCTIVNNVSGASTINAESDGSEYIIINNIFSGNTASGGNAPLINTAEQIEFEAKHNLVWDWEGKVSVWEPRGLFLPDVDGNFEGDPMFVEVDDGDLHLQEGSAAIDAGMTLDNVTADIAGVERPQGTAYDIGAYEYVDPVSVIDISEAIPQQYELSQNYPNPFNPTTTIAFGLPEQAQVILDVYNVLGQRIRTLVGGDTYQAGYYQVVWDGRDQLGNTVSSGIYIYRLTAGEFNELRKMVFIK